MFGFNCSADGPALISSAIGAFESFAKKIDAGVTKCRERCSYNAKLINELAAESHELTATADRGEAFAAKLRELIG